MTQRHDPGCRCRDCLEADYARRHRPLHDWWGAFLGITALAGFAWALTQSAYSACQDAIVAAANQGSCGGWMFWHDLAEVAGLAGLVLFIVAVAS